MGSAMLRGPVPLYYQILEILRGRIHSSRHAAGDQLPTDEALMREFGVSRHTVRTAVQQLVADGLIERFPGKGTFVLERPAPGSNWVIESLEDLIGTSFADRYEIVSAGFERAGAHPRSAALYHLAPEDRLFTVRAVRSSAVGPYAYSDIHFPPDIGGRLPKRRFTQRPLILLVEESCGLRAFEARQVATAAAADPEAARRLEVRRGQPLLVLERTYFTREGRAIEMARIRYRPDRFQHVVNFSRREDLPFAASRTAAAPRLRDAGGRSGGRATRFHSQPPPATKESQR